MEVIEEFCKTLKPITDFTTLNEGDKMFNRFSLDIKYRWTFEKIEKSDGVITLYYKNYYGDHFNECVFGDEWYYIT